LLAACGGGPPPPTIVDLTVAGAPDLNPDSSGRASPVVVRLYELVSPSTFQDADFFQIYDDAAGTLAADLQGTDEMVVSPGASRTLQRELKPDTRWLGVIASYRDIDRASWRATLPVPPNETTPVTVTVGADAVTMAKGS
jgi:type VI secretion system protein VasD